MKKIIQGKKKSFDRMKVILPGFNAMNTKETFFFNGSYNDLLKRAHVRRNPWIKKT